jgi:hypothetical protein
VRERRGRALQGSIDLSKCQERLSNPGLRVHIPPFPLLVVVGKTRTSRTVRDALADCPCLNSNGKNAKSTAGGLTVGPGGPSARTTRTVRLGPADCPRAGRPVHRAAPCFVKNNGPSAWGPRTVRLEAHFLENFCQKSQILNKYKKPTDRPPQGPGLSAQHLKTDFS